MMDELLDSARNIVKTDKQYEDFIKEYQKSNNLKPKVDEDVMKKIKKFTDQFKSRSGKWLFKQRKMVLMSL